MPAPTAQPSASPHRLRPPPVTPRLTLFGAVVVAALAGALLAYSLRPAGPATPGGAGPAPSTGRAPVAAAPAPAAPAPPSLGVAPARTPPPWLKPSNEHTPSLTLAELQELQQTLAASHPDDKFAELGEQMLLADATRRFLQLHRSTNADPQELHGLVELIGPVLDAQFRRGELARADAVELKWKLLQVQYPQASMQQGELTRWLAAQAAR